MRADQIEIGKVYRAMVSGRSVRLKVIDRIHGTRHPFLCRNLETGREVQKNAASLHVYIEPKRCDDCGGTLNLLGRCYCPIPKGKADHA